jgi:predicted XRE-type DNA-binding protein
MTRQKTKQDVFADLGFAPAEAENLRIRSAIMRASVSPSRAVSDLMRGKIHLFSIDNLVVLLAAAGLRIDLKVKRAAESIRLIVIAARECAKSVVSRLHHAGEDSAIDHKGGTGNEGTGFAGQ